MNIKNMEKRKKVIIASAFASLTTLFYSQWEIPTFLYGKEFHNPEMVDNIERDTGSMVGDPIFIKLIDYQEKEATILWVDRGGQMVIEMKKVKSESERLKWKTYTWYTCKPANGAPTCFFPWYGQIPIF
jgi:hypothetical protein